MSGADPASVPTSKMLDNEDQGGNNTSEQQQQQQRKKREMEEDDEFEDFPVEDWPDEETELADAPNGEASNHLWEESWDDDDTNEDFARMLKEELKKVEAAKQQQQAR